MIMPLIQFRSCWFTQSRQWILARDDIKKIFFKLQIKNKTFIGECFTLQLNISRRRLKSLRYWMLIYIYIYISKIRTIVPIIHNVQTSAYIVIIYKSCGATKSFIYSTVHDMYSNKLISDIARLIASSR